MKLTLLPSPPFAVTVSRANVWCIYIYI